MAGLWLLSVLLFVSSMLYIFSTKEIEVSILEHHGCKMQMIAESILERELKCLQEDFAYTKELFHGKEGWDVIIDTGSIEKWRYTVRCKPSGGSLWLYADVENMETVNPDPWHDSGVHDYLEGKTGLRWRLHVDEDEETVELEGIG